MENVVRQLAPVAVALCWSVTSGAQAPPFPSVGQTGSVGVVQSPSLPVVPLASLTTAVTRISGLSAILENPDVLVDAMAPLSEFTKLLPLPMMLTSKAREMIRDMAVKMEVEKGYRPMELNKFGELPQPLARVESLRLLLRRTADGTHVIRLGVHAPPRAVPRLWIQSFVIQAGAVAANPDTPDFGEIINNMVAASNRPPHRVKMSDLGTAIINLSYADSDAALYMLAAMGVSVIAEDTPVEQFLPTPGSPLDPPPPVSSSPDSPSPFGSPAPSPFGVPAPSPFGAPWPSPFGAPWPSPFGSASSFSAPGQAAAVARYPTRNIPTTIPYDKLPLVFKVPAPDPAGTGLVGDSAAGASAAASGAFGATTIAGAGKLANSTVATGTTQLLVLYDRDDPESLGNVKNLIAQYIDTPARQIYIEGMVLELSSSLLEQLGIDLTRRTGNAVFTLGSIVSGGANTLNLTRDSTLNFDPLQFVDRLRALIREGKAEVLSRPSVLTLDNRQATIRVGTDIPIATSKSGSGGTGGTDINVSFSFQYISTGILLNIRPRIEANGTEISMTIDTTVSATVPGGDLEVRDATGTRVLASAPQITSRRVQTYARLRNNTPLIIGGLVSRESITSRDSIPLIGKIPFIGNLLGYNSKNALKREVIIVLTPYVLSEDNRLPRTVPKDDEKFDLSKTTLFRDSYRIRTEDVYDTRYLRTNVRLRAYQSLVNALLLKEPQLERQQPFARFAKMKIPGEEALVHGMYYNMLARLKVGEPIGLEDFVFWDPAANASNRETNLEFVMRRYGDGKDYRSFFTKNPGKALALTFTFDRDAMTDGKLDTEPRPKIALVDCPDRDTWSRLLWDMSGVGSDGLKRYTILIQDESDLIRLRNAQAIKRTISVNGGDSFSTISHFLTGQMISIPLINKEQKQLLEATVAQLFFHTEHHRRVFAEEIESAIKAVDAALRQPRFVKYRDDLKLPKGIAGEPVVIPAAANPQAGDPR